METGQPFDPNDQPAYIINEFNEIQIEFSEFSERLRVSEYKVGQDQGSTSVHFLPPHVYIST